MTLSPKTVDTLPTTTTTSKPILQSKADWPDCPYNPKFIGDGVCLEHFKSLTECNHDGGDCCEEVLISNRICEVFNNFSSCSNYDGGDCPSPIDNIIDWPECPHHPKFIGDGICDNHLQNISECNHDNEDCCDHSLIGNGVCNTVNNIPTCSYYDAGDCRPPNITDWPECPHNPEFIGDGTCNDHLKTKAECNFDSHDCACK